MSSDYRNALAAGRTAYDRGEPSTANPYATAAREGMSVRDIVVDELAPNEVNPKAAALARLWLTGWQSGRDAAESSR
ncbi:MAG: hypothetical protein JWN03_1179 [Nocardia sp.]|uniref:hypothetical protein n=1 Tax=Nocardia sp. TaxID=1821 RepID=UPI0026208B09|nr:hypothetical protein [Nocardia sp.]MCU1640904.1 hypothetical protein [Nocardia sp.]